MQHKRAQKKHKMQPRKPEGKRPPKKASTILYNFLNSPNKINADSESEARLSGHQISKRNVSNFFIANIGTQAKAEKPADSNGSVSQNDMLEGFALGGAKISPNLAKKETSGTRSKLNLSEQMSLLQAGGSGEDSESLEDPLRDFIALILGYYDQFNICTSFMEKYEDKVSQLETLSQIFQLLREMLQELMTNIMRDCQGLLDCSDVSEKQATSSEMDFVLYQLQKEIRGLTAREKELNRLSCRTERKLAAKEAEVRALKTKYDEVGALRRLKQGLGEAE